MNDLNEPVSGETPDRPEMRTQDLKRESAPHLALDYEILNVHVDSAQLNVASYPRQ